MHNSQPATSGSTRVLSNAMLANNPAWAQLLGLCPLLAVSSTLTNALGLACASAFVVIGSNTLISILRGVIPQFARLPCFVLIIATFTTLTTMFLEAYAFDLYAKIALFVQIIVTNCMILGRVEAFASQHGVLRALADAAGTATGFALALLAVGAVRELLGHGTLMMGMEMLFPGTEDWGMTVSDAGMLLATLPPGAFIVAGLLLGLGPFLPMDPCKV